MSTITAEMIERGRMGRDAGERRRRTQRVQQVREKLTSGGEGHGVFEVELLRLYAVGRAGATYRIIGLTFAMGLLASLWTPTFFIIGWVTSVIAASYICKIQAEKFLDIDAPQPQDVVKWRRKFLGFELLTGLTWAPIAGVLLHMPQAEGCTLFLTFLLFVSALNAMSLAPLPFAIYAATLPLGMAIIGVEASFGIDRVLLPTTAFVWGAFGSFALVSRRLYETSLQSLYARAEKDGLIAELEQAKSNSDEARRRAEEANLAKSRFLATMSHELRTPLNAILGFSEVMQSELFGAHNIPAYRDYSNDIHTSGQHLLALINEILDLSRVEAGRYELKEDAVSLIGIIEDCRHLLTLRAQKREITLNQTIELNLPRLWADERAVRQVVLNLMTNAIKFTPQGGQVTIKVGWTTEGGQYFSVKDTGPGIPENEIPVVMSSFGRGALAQKNADEGSGLGLPIVKGLVELHGGVFTLRSKVREGTEVVVVFPPQRVMDALPRLEEPDTHHVDPYARYMHKAA